MLISYFFRLSCVRRTIEDINTIKPTKHFPFFILYLDSNPILSTNQRQSTPSVPNFIHMTFVRFSIISLRCSGVSILRQLNEDIQSLESALTFFFIDTLILGGRWFEVSGVKSSSNNVTCRLLAFFHVVVESFRRVFISHINHSEMRFLRKLSISPQFRREKLSFWISRNSLFNPKTKSSDETCTQKLKVESRHYRRPDPFAKSKNQFSLVLLIQHLLLLSYMNFEEVKRIRNQRRQQWES